MRATREDATGSAVATTCPDALPAPPAHPARRPPSLRPRSVPAWLQGLVALAIYAVFWLVKFVPSLITHPTLPLLDQSSMDPDMFIWSLGWWPYAVAHGLNPMQAFVIGAPAGYNLSWLTTVPGLALLASPLTAAFGPIVSFNLLVAIAPPLAGWAAFVLCRRLTGRFWPSLAGGVVYGFSAFEMNHTVAGHLNLTFSLLLPLMAYLVLLWRDGRIGRGAFISLLTLGLILQMFLFLETFAELTLMWVAALTVGYLLARRSMRPLIARLSRHVALAYLATVLLTSPYLYYVLTHTPSGFAQELGGTSLDLASVVTPRSSRSFDISWLAHFSASLPSISLAGYIGIPLLLVVVLLAVRTWKSRLTRFLVIMFGFAILVAAGPDLAVGTLQPLGLPWAFLFRLPLTHSAFPVRVVVFADLGAAVMLARWLTLPLKRPALRWLLGLVAVASVIANIPYVAATEPSHTRLPAFITTGEYRRYITPGEIVVVVSHRGNAGMLWQADTHFYFRVAGGFVNQAITAGSDLPTPLAALWNPSEQLDQAALTYLRQDRIGAILIEDGWPTPGLVVPAIYQLGLRGQVIGGVTVIQLIHGHA